MMKTFLASLLLTLLPLSLLAQPMPLKRPHATRTAKTMRAKPVAVAPAPVALSAEELVLAERVYVGRLPCELGAVVNLQADPKAPGYFQVQLGKQKFHMMPVATTTGAIRLEDRKAGAVWLQLANKSMMVSDKLGRRLVDACMNPDQELFAQVIETDPIPTVLDDVPGSPTFNRTTVAVKSATE
jgi:hypothetical protein